MTFKLFLPALLILAALSCRNTDSSDLSEVVGRSRGETIKERSDQPFTYRRSGPTAASVKDEAEGVAEASFAIFERFTVYHEEERTYTDFVWDEKLERASGTESAWQGYFLFDEPQRDKPELLEKAVLGIGPATAEAVVKLTHQGAPLSSRPKSWEAFKKQMKEIDELFEKKSKYKHLRGLYKNVVMDNGGQNIRKLGYQVEGQELKPVQRRQLVEWSTVEREIKDRYSWRVPVVVRVTGVELLPSETETFRAYLSANDEDDARMTVDSDFGEYQIDKRQDRGEVVFTLTGRRKAARPPNVVVLRVSRAGESIEVEFTDTARSKLGKNAGDVTVDFSVRRDTNRWFTEKNLGDHSLRLNGDRGSKRIPVSKLKSGENFVVRWTIRRENAPAYDGKKPSDNETKNVRVN